ncbi:octanoyltransferase, partial [Escherichia coli]
RLRLSWFAALLVAAFNRYAICRFTFHNGLFIFSAPE